MKKMTLVGYLYMLLKTEQELNAACYTPNLGTVKPNDVRLQV